ncbi:CP2 transcription factor, partial [Thamnocephalis sphaerospora]
KGQFYNIALEDTLKQECTLETTMRIMFHEKAHRRLANTYWSHWLSQQSSPRTARALDINVRFRWSGQRGATVQVRFNCLSTEFSRVKGVKGIPMRVQAETRVVSSESLSGERAFAAIKLFRDKGAERKNKDDLRHRERLVQRMRAKSSSSQRTSVDALPQAFPVTVF